MTDRSVRALLALDVTAMAAVGAVAALALGLPLCVNHALTPGAFVAVVAGGSVVSAVLGTALLWRAVARPVDRLLAAAELLRGDGGMPVLGDGSGPGLSRASVAFARVVEDLEEERRRVAGKAEELARAGEALGETRVHLARSERLATVGRLAAGLAHEVGNPLGAIAGYAEVARSRVPPGADPELGAAVQRIADATARIDRILHDLLDFARPTPARVDRVQVGGLVESAVRLARVQPRFREVEVALDLPAGLPALRGDAHQLGQVLLNVLLNAGDAMRGRGRVEIAARPLEGTVELAVADQGPGIRPEHLPRVFDPFFTTKEPGQGTGLGLAISYRIVEQHGGVLSVENRPRGGAVFRLRLPAMAAGEAGAGAC
jgi:two-component system, NtrC family, sensor kinase